MTTWVGTEEDGDGLGVGIADGEGVGVGGREVRVGLGVGVGGCCVPVGTGVGVPYARRTWSWAADAPPGATELTGVPHDDVPAANATAARKPRSR